LEVNGRIGRFGTELRKLLHFDVQLQQRIRELERQVEKDSDPEFLGTRTALAMTTT